jgi:hypothetical protein
MGTTVSDSNHSRAYSIHAVQATLADLLLFKPVAPLVNTEGKLIKSPKWSTTCKQASKVDWQLLG